MEEVSCVYHGLMCDSFRDHYLHKNNDNSDAYVVFDLYTI